MINFIVSRFPWILNPTHSFSTVSGYKCSFYRAFCSPSCSSLKRLLKTGLSHTKSHIITSSIRLIILHQIIKELIFFLFRKMFKSKYQKFSLNFTELFTPRFRIFFIFCKYLLVCLIYLIFDFVLHFFQGLKFLF